MSEPECGRCKAPAGWWVCRVKLYPLDPDKMICLSRTPPGPDWWASVKRFWDVGDAPLQSHWHPPELVKVERGRCGFCRKLEAPQTTPSLFDESEEP